MKNYIKHVVQENVSQKIGMLRYFVSNAWKSVQKSLGKSFNELLEGLIHSWHQKRKSKEINTSKAKKQDCIFWKTYR